MKMANSAIWGFVFGMLVLPIINASTVPVIAWSSSRNLFSTRPIAAGEEISQESLRKDFLDPAIGSSPQTIVVVLLNKLSLGDLTRFGDAYGSSSHGGIIPTIKTSMETAASSMVLPQTDTSEMVEDLVSKVMGQQGEVTEIKDQSELKGFKVDPSKTDLLIVHIEPSGSMEEQLSAADSYVKAAMALVKGKAPQTHFTVLFTAVQTAQRSSHASGRRLLQSEDASATPSDFLLINYTSAGCQVFLYVNKTTVSSVVGDKIINSLVLPTEGWTTNGTTCLSNTSVDFNFGISDLKENGTDAWISSLSVMMKVRQTSNGGYWYLNETTLSYTLKEKSDQEEILLPDNLETPVGWSYHCGNITFAEYNSTGTSLLLNLFDFQLQPFAITDEKFSRANECVGFFTEAIWMGIMTALLVIVVISFGISMMAAVRVMDKFDDPKGKQLVISVPES